MIVSTDRDIARTALLAKGLREAGQTIKNAFHTFADKPEMCIRDRGISLISVIPEERMLS